MGLFASGKRDGAGTDAVRHPRADMVQHPLIDVLACPLMKDGGDARQSIRPSAVQGQFHLFPRRGFLAIMHRRGRFVRFPGRFKAGFRLVDPRGMG